MSTPMTPHRLDGAVNKALVDFTLDDTTGEFEAVVATLNVTDRHGDVLVPGFAGEQDVRIVWGHNWEQPIGKGRVFEEGDVLKAEGRFFVDVPSAREKYDLVRNMGDMQEWSWGFFIRDGATEKDGDGRRLIKAMPDGSPGVDIFEVSPVLVGAGVGTRTLAMKSDADNTGIGDYTITDGPKRLVDELADAARVLQSAVERTAEVVALRAEKGRSLGADTMSALEELRHAVDDAHKALVDMDPAPTPTDADGELAERWRDLYRTQLRQALAAQGIR